MKIIIGLTIFAAVLAAVAFFLRKQKQNESQDLQREVGINRHSPAIRPSEDSSGVSAPRAAKEALNEAVAGLTQKPAEPTAGGIAAPAEEWIPEDSALRRHYLSEKAARKLALSNPYPTDSALRRHYDTQAANWLGATKPALGLTAVSAPEAAAAPVVDVKSVPPEAKAVIPEDSALRRHFLSLLRSQIEAELPPKPSDSVLRRHYQTLVQSKLDAYLRELTA